MMHRFLLCTLLVSLAASAQPEQRGYASDSWSWAYPSEEGGGGSSYMGVDIADVSPERLGELKLKEEHGAEITMVDQDAPAGKAGLHEHDVIVNLNGTPVESAAQLRRMIRETPPGRVVNLGISRDGQPLTIKLQLADRHKSMEWEPNVSVHIPQLPQIPKMPMLPDFDLPVSVVVVHSSARSGLMVENITAQLGDFFGVKDGKGVLVRSVEKGSLGEKSGFRAGDVVVKVNDQPVHDTSDFTHALRSSSGKTAAVTVMREKREQNLTLTLPERKDSGRLLEETLEIPELTAETEQAINLAGDRIALIGPAVEKALQESNCWTNAGQSLKERRQELQERQNEMRERLQERQQELQDQQQEMQEQQQERQQEMQEEQQDQQQELQEQQQEMQERQRELEQELLRKYSGTRAEI
jgi:serine protease Do